MRKWRDLKGIPKWVKADTNRGRGDDGAHQRDGSAGVKGSNEGVSRHKDEKALVWLRAIIEPS